MTASVKNSRIALRASDETKDRLQEAAQITGQDLSAFILEAANARARQILLEDKIIRFSDADLLQIEEALENPPAPNDALRALVRKCTPQSRRGRD